MGRMSRRSDSEIGVRASSWLERGGGSGEVPASTWCDRAASEAASQRRSCALWHLVATSSTKRVSPGSASVTGAGGGSKSIPRSAATRASSSATDGRGAGPLGAVESAGSVGMSRIVPESPPTACSSTSSGLPTTAFTTRGVAGWPQDCAARHSATRRPRGAGQDDLASLPDSGYRTQ